MLGMVACGGPSRRLDNAADSTNQPAPAAPQNSGPQQRSRLTTSLPSLAGRPAGAQFDFVLRADLAEPVFQGSARVLYDSRAVEPVSAVRGDLLPAAAVFLARTDAAPGTLELSTVDRTSALDGCVPFAFTGRPGAAPLDVRAGELLRVTFRLKTPAPDGVVVRLQNDPDFLQLRDSGGQRVSFDLAREAGVR